MISNALTRTARRSGSERLTRCVRRFAHVPAAPPSATINRNGWSWDAALTVDENYVDLAFLVAKSSPATGRVGCAVVDEIDDGSARQAQGRIIAVGVNSGLYSHSAADCHAEANVVAESAGLGWPLRGSTCYVSKPPCNQCFSLLSVVGVARIVTPGGPPDYTSKKSCVLGQSTVAAELGIEYVVVPCSTERIERRERLAAENRDWDRVYALRERKSAHGSQIELAMANLRSFSADVHR